MEINPLKKKYSLLQMSTENLEETFCSKKEKCCKKFKKKGKFCKKCPKQ
jgi:hypothetical protein